MTKKALILGVTGQDGSYLSDILIQRGYEVHGMYRRVSNRNLDNLELSLSSTYASQYHNKPLTLHQGDMGDPISIHKIINEVRPTELYNMADQDHVGWSYGTPSYNYDITGAAVGRLLESVKMIDPTTRVFQPVTALMFGGSDSRLNEESPLNPQSPYACAKAMAFYLCKYYRQVHNLYVNCGIMFNHDSPRRKGDYLLHSIAKQALDVASGKATYVTVGDPDMVVDIGYARDYMAGVADSMWVRNSNDYIFGTGDYTSIRNLVITAITKAHKKLDKSTPSSYDELICIDPTLVRPGKRPIVISDPNRARSTFGFTTYKSASDVMKLIIECAE